MIKNSWLVAIVVFVVLAIGLYTLFGREDNSVYEEKIKKEREDKNRFMRYNNTSPLSDAQKADFRELEYFPIDPEFKIKARLEAVESDKMLVLPTNDGKEERYLKYAYANFILKGKQQRLLILQPMVRQFQNKLFLIFTDETTGEETYGACRYIDLVKETDQSITIDFNMAYNPYCAYTDEFSCPLPPAGNHVTVAITAGEKDFLPGVY
jgi:uncharacterized protein